MPQPRQLQRRSLPASLALLIATACGAAPAELDAPGAATSEIAAPSAPRHPVTLRLPSTLGTVDTDLRDAQGRPIGVRCATCHAAGSRPPMAERSGLDTFHQGIELRHGALSCATCHPADDRTELRLADDTRIEFRDVQRLCAQCHGPQHRDYVNGAHGGMRGYWDLTRGPRERNACVVCHAAHAPAYPKVRPAPPPRDRFLDTSRPEEVPHG